MKKSFTKRELIELLQILTKEEMLPCDGMKIYKDERYSNKFAKWNIKFVKKDKLKIICLATKRELNIKTLSDQLWEYVGGGR